MKHSIISRRISIKLILSVVISAFLAMISVYMFSAFIAMPYIMMRTNSISVLEYNILAVMIFTIGITVFLVIFLSLVNKKIKYIKYISEQINKIANEQLGSTLKVKGNDELSDLSSILIQMLGEYTPVLETKGLKIITDIDEKIPVKIDIEKIVRVFDNILSNAEKYSIKPSDIIVKAESKVGFAHISISNKGEYIEQDKLNKMFEKFYRIDISRSSSIEGSGLGLAISKKIVNLHNGQIWAEYNDEMITINIKLPISYKDALDNL